MAKKGTWNGETIGPDPAKGERSLGAIKTSATGGPAANLKGPQPDTPSASHKAMQPVWDKVDAVLGGTEVMRRRGEIYLPKHDGEKDQRYNERRDRAVLTNVSQLTLDSWVGRPFADPLHIDDEVPAPIQEFLKDVNLQGDAVGVFCRAWFRTGLAKAVAHVLVDFPMLEADPNRTAADDQKENRRPYWCPVAPENVLFASAQVVNGREILTHLRIREDSIERVGWGEAVISRIRVFDHNPVDSTTVYSLYRFDPRRKRWFLEQTPTGIDVDQIPLVTFYADRSGLHEGKPPIEDLVDLNIAHYQSDSDQVACLTVARFPILSVSGVDDEEVNKVIISPHLVLSTPDPSGRWYYTEHSGAALEQGSKHLAELEERMGHYGAEFLRRQPGSKTATARALDSAESTSPLEDATTRFNDALAQAMDLTAKWMKLEMVGKVAVETDLGPQAIDQSDYQALLTARQSRDISRIRLTSELKRRGVLDEDYDADADQALLDAETMSGDASLPIDEQQPTAKVPPGNSKPPFTKR